MPPIFTLLCNFGQDYFPIFRETLTMSSATNNLATPCAAHKPGWAVEYRDANGGSHTQIEVSSADGEHATTRASQFLEIWKPGHALISGQLLVLIIRQGRTMKWLKNWYDGEGLLVMKVRRAIWHAMKLPESTWVNDVLNREDQRYNSPARKAQRATVRRRFVAITLPLILAAIAMLTFAVSQLVPNLIGLPVAIAIFFGTSLMVLALFWPE